MPLHRRTFWLLLLGIVLASNVAAEWGARRLSGWGAPVALADAPPSGTTIAWIGTSYARTAYSESGWRKGWEADGPAPVVVATDVTTSAEQLVLLDRLLEHAPTIQWVVFPFSYGDINWDATSSFGDLVFYRSMAYWFTDSREANVAFGDELRWMRWVRLVPMVSQRALLAGQIQTWVRGPVKTFGVGYSPDEMLHPLPKQDAEWSADVPAWTRGNRLSRQVQRMMELVRQHGARMVVVEKPVCGGLLERDFGTVDWDALRKMNQRLVEQMGGSYIDASRWVPDSRKYVWDCRHLGRRGAELFSERLAKQIRTLARE
jgi:hypothetical protein